MLGKLEWIRRADAPETVQDSEFDPRPFADELLRYAYFRLGSKEDAEDVVASVMHESTVRSKQIASAENPRLYMIGMVRRKVADHQRSRRWRTLSLDQLPFDAVAEDAAIEALQRKNLIANVMRKLDDDHREVLALKYLQGFSTEESAQIMGRSPQAVNSLLQRARAAFAEAAGSTFEDES